MHKILFLLILPFFGSAQVSDSTLVSDVFFGSDSVGSDIYFRRTIVFRFAAPDTTRGAAAILTEGSITTQLPDGATATNTFLRIEPLRAYMVRMEDRLRLFRESDGVEIPLRDLIHFKPDEK